MFMDRDGPDSEAPNKDQTTLVFTNETVYRPMPLGWAS